MLRINVDELKQAAAGRAVELLAALGGIPADVLDGRHHPCPKCGGTDRFRLIDAETGAVLCNQCFDQKNGDFLAALQWARGWTLPETLKQAAEHLGVKPAKSKKQMKALALYPDESAVKATLVKQYASKELPDQAPEVVREDTYDTFVVLRVNLPTEPGRKQKKTYRPVYRGRLSDGREGFILGYPDGPRSLFRRKELAEAPKDLVVICGGEKAVEAAAGLGLTATTCAGGEKAVKKTDWSPLIEFSQVVVSIDNDAAGARYGELVAEALWALKPGLPIKILELPGLPKAGDVVEWIEAGGARETFLELAAAAKPHEPTVKVDYDLQILDEMGIDVLGEMPNGVVKVFSAVTRKTIALDNPRPAHLTYCDMLQRFGEVIRDKVAKTQDETGPGMYHLDRVKEAIATVGGRERAGDGVEVGRGCWEGTNGEVVIVGAGDGLVWHNGRAEKFDRPRICGLKANLASGDDWYNHDRLAADLVDCDQKYAGDAVDEAIDLFKNWYWQEGGKAKDTIPCLLVGMILATWVQTFFPWRPQVSIIGPSDSGKSMFFELLETLFGPLCLLSSKSTEAGIRQAVRNQACAILCDEFESDKHRKNILEYLRTSSRGGKILRGTANQEGQSFGLRHIAWVAGIELGLEREPDHNRWLLLELQRPPADKRGKLTLPPEPEIAALGQRLLATAVRHVHRAREIADWLKGRQIEDTHGRVVESYAVPAAMLTSVRGGSLADAVDLLQYLLGGIPASTRKADTDEYALLGTILDSQVNLSRGRQEVVSYVLTHPEEFTDGYQSLEKVGIACCGNNRGPRPTIGWIPDVMFILGGPARRYLLQGTAWDKQSIEQHLGRLPGATRDRRLIAGKRRSYGVAIPWSLLLERFFGEEGVVNAQNEF